MSKTNVNERKTRLKTIRLTESLVRSLEKEAADEGTTVNADVNSIISQHLEYDKKAQEFGFAAIPKPLLKSMLEGLGDETLARIGREIVPAMWREMAEFWSGDSSPDEILNALAMRSKFDPDKPTKVTREDGSYTVVMRHDFGPKWSIIAKNALQEFVKRAFHVEPQMSQGESVITARFKVKPQKLSS